MNITGNNHFEKHMTTNLFNSLTNREESKGNPARIIFAIDATASRSHVWDVVSKIQKDMFSSINRLGELEIKLMYFRGENECKASPWLKDQATLLKLLNKVTCLAGSTQILRVLDHASAEHDKSNVNAIIFIGDSCEENFSAIETKAEILGLKKLPVFVFHDQNGADVATHSRSSETHKISDFHQARYSLAKKSFEKIGKDISATKKKNDKLSSDMKAEVSTWKEYYQGLINRNVSLDEINNRLSSMVSSMQRHKTNLDELPQTYLDINRTLEYERAKVANQISEWDIWGHLRNQSERLAISPPSGTQESAAERTSARPFDSINESYREQFRGPDNNHGPS